MYNVMSDWLKEQIEKEEEEEEKKHWKNQVENVKTRALVTNEMFRMLKNYLQVQLAKLPDTNKTTLYRKKNLFDKVTTLTFEILNIFLDGGCASSYISEKLEYFLIDLLNENLIDKSFLQRIIDY